MTTPLAPRLARRIAVQRGLMLWEELWPRLQRPLMALGLAYVVVGSGLLLGLPAALRLVMVVALLGLLIWALRDLRGLSLPTRPAAMARLERAAGLAHQPLQSLADQPAVGSADDPLWAEHRRRQEEKLTALRLSLPRSPWRSFDPRALRVPVVLGVIATAILSPLALRDSVQAALALSPATAPAAVALEAWLTPPAYTGKPPLLLTRKGGDADAAAITVPEGSVLQLRLGNAAAPRIIFTAEGDTHTEATPADLKTSLQQGRFSASAKLTRPVTVVVSDGSELARWNIALVPDQAPVIALKPPAVVDARGGLGLPFEASDDYGLAAITATIALADDQADGPGFASNGIFLFDAPEFPVKLSKPLIKTEKAVARGDLTSHPWAGFRVTITLSARDAAGHDSDSAPLTLDLPERPFTKLMARAVIEQRRRLILDADQAADVAALLRALLTYPGPQFERSGDILMLAAIASRLERTAEPDDIKDAVKNLWDVAVAIEDGRLAEPRAALDKARQALEEALAQGAPPEKIQALMAELRAAMNRYLQALGNEARKQPPSPGQGRTLSGDDLQKMLDDIEKLSRNGAGDQARQMLSELDQILRNLQTGDSADNGEAMRQLNDLTDILRQQQKLMDETQRQAQGGNSEAGGSEPPDPGAGSESGAPSGQGDNGTRQQPDQGGSNGTKPGGPGSSLSGRQGDLRSRTEGLGRELGPGQPKGLGEAQNHMKDAQKSLGEGDNEAALGAQGKAMQALRQALQGMAQEMLQTNNGGTGGNRDPLGRERNGNGRNPATNLKLPSEQAMQRARELLELLRQRSADPSLAPVERDYIDRLLKGLY